MIPRVAASSKRSSVLWYMIPSVAASGCTQCGGNDNEILFADSVIKVNRKFISQLQIIVVTDKNVYKYFPSGAGKNLKLKQHKTVKMGEISSSQASLIGHIYILEQLLWLTQIE